MKALAKNKKRGQGQFRFFIFPTALIFSFLAMGIGCDIFFPNLPEHPQPDCPAISLLILKPFLLPIARHAPFIILLTSRIMPLSPATVLRIISSMRTIPTDPIPWAITMILSPAQVTGTVRRGPIGRSSKTIGLTILVILLL